MGWLAIACICGFFGYRCWRLTSDWLVRRGGIAAAEILYAAMASAIVFAALVLCAIWSFLFLVVGMALGFAVYGAWRWLSDWSAYPKSWAWIAGSLILIGMILWASLLQDAKTYSQLVDVLEGGQVARFLVALLLGMALGILLDWRRVPQSLAAKYKITVDGADTFAGVVGFLFVFLGLVMWAIMAREARTPGAIADELQNGRVARFLLGLVLGLGAAAVMTDRSRVASAVTNDQRAVPPAQKPQDQNAGAAPQPEQPRPVADVLALQGGAASSADDAKRDIPMLWIFSTGLSIALLALAAPHLDDWLRRATAFKSPYIELQLASASTHKISVEEGAEVLLGTDSLSYLAAYGEKIQQDIDYLTNYTQEVPHHDEIISKASELWPTFNQVFGPIAKCVQAAIDHEWLSVDSARQMLRPTANAAEEIIFAEDTLNESQRLGATYDRFWKHVLSLPEQVTLAVKEKECAAITVTENSYTSGNSPDLFPKIQPNYEKVPYLYVAAALLSSFMGDNDKALRILQMAESKLIFKDYFFLLLKARLSYYSGKPGDIGQTYLGPLDEMRLMARSHIDALEKKGRECSSPDTAILICRDLLAELQAKNYIAYFIAEDLARGSEYVGPYVERLQEYAEDVKRAASEPVSNNTRHKGFYQILGQGLYNRYIPVKYAALDTYAYATLVVEARKPSPDYDLIRSKLIPILRQTTDTAKSLYENAPIKATMAERARLYQVKIAEAHLASAREFVGE